MGEDDARSRTRAPFARSDACRHRTGLRDDLSDDLSDKLSVYRHSRDHLSCGLKHESA
ncbi:hypothetical protein PSAB6_100063 [Paraburkholderia sabiae]|nr:hypothetical protein PSAB6_100063 [Paraburkholderia sabiae]